MSAKIENIHHIANLARLALSDDEAAQLTTNLEGIVDFIEQLGDVDTDEVEPMAHPMDQSQRLRVDQPNADIDRDRYQANAPAVEAGLYLVPKVIE